MSKLNESLKNLSEDAKANLGENKAYQEGRGRGYFNESIVEPSNTLRHDITEDERVITCPSNAWIVMGRDRPYNEASGYGGRGATDCGAIDIIAGKASSAKFDSKEEKTVSPLRFNDAARIYISEKTDLDKDFGIVETKNFKNKYFRARSGIGIKADTVRLIGREGIKLVTGKAQDASGGGPMGEPNSRGGEIIGVRGIDLIAGNISGEETGFDFSRGSYSINRSQPIPKGENLAESLNTLADHIHTISDTLRSFMKNQQKINNRLMTHVHVATAPGAPTLPSVGLSVTCAQIAPKNSLKVLSLRTLSKAIKMHKINYLDEDGKFWICSRFNTTN